MDIRHEDEGAARAKALAAISMSIIEPAQNRKRKIVEPGRSTDAHVPPRKRNKYVENDVLSS